MVVEALAEGLPVVCLDRGGPPVLGGTGVRATAVAGTVLALATAVDAAGGLPLPPFPTTDSVERRLRSILTRSFPWLELTDGGSPAPGAAVVGDVVGGTR